MPPIRVGDPAPPITAKTHTGQEMSLADYRGRQTVVLYFYPKDETAICTREACAFRDAYEDFVADGAVVLGVSSDSLEQHRQFAERRQLPFLLISDSEGAIRRAFGVPKTFGLLPGRVTYVIDREGVVRHIFNAQFTAARHVAEARKVVRQLAWSATDAPSA